MDLLQLKESTKDFKVLYVEDSLTIRNITKKMLLEFFDHIDVAKDGKEAFSLYKNYYDENNQFYDIVFTDLEMPIMDGKELSELIINFNDQQEIVVISGVDDFRKAIELINIGIKKFMPKPVIEEELAAVIEDVVRSIRKKILELAQKIEIEEYNEILKEREEESQKALDDKIQELKEFSDALEIGAIVAKTDLEGVITYVNDKFCKVSGYTHDELVGNKMSMINARTRSNSFFQKLWNRISSKKTHRALFENRHKDGSIYYIESTISPILDTQNEITEYIAVAHDMTQLMRSLEARKEAEKSKEDFFINISHEMKTPLNSILGFSSLLLKQAKEDKTKMMLSSIVETGNDLNYLIESVLDINRIKQNQLLLRDVLFSPIDEITKCLDKYKNKAEQKNQNYSVEVDEHIPISLIGDLERVIQVIGIMIDNAIKFTAENSGVISINLFYDQVAKNLVCEVRDNGIGIEKENQEKIFEIHQVDGSTTRGYEGAGLGLNIASNIIKIMNGNIAVKSIPGKGSLFIVEFPLKQN